MLQGFVNATVTPTPSSLPDERSDPVQYVLFGILAFLLVVPCVVYCWKVGCLPEACCRRRSTGPLTRGRDDFVDNIERAASVGSFVGHPGGGPNYRLMSHQHMLFVHGQGPQGAPALQVATAPSVLRMPKNVSFSEKLDQVARGTNAIVCEPSAPLAPMRMQDKQTKFNHNEV